MIGGQQKIQQSSLQINNSDSSPSKKYTSPNLAKPMGKELINKEEILLSIEPKLFSSRNIGTAKVVLTNNTKEQILTGQRYFVERYNGTIWKKLKYFDELTHEDFGYIVTSLNSKEFIVNLNSISSTSAPGKYRVGKDVYVSKKKTIITAEFTVK